MDQEKEIELILKSNPVLLRVAYLGELNGKMLFAGAARQDAYAASSPVKNDRYVPFETKTHDMIIVNINNWGDLWTGPNRFPIDWPRKFLTIASRA